MRNYILLLLLLSSSILYSQEIITDRPDQTESPVAVSPGIIQVESGLLFQRAEAENGFTLHRSVYPTNLFRIGLVKNLELRVVNEISTYELKGIADTSRNSEETFSGTEDLQIGFKYQITPLESKVVLGLMAHLYVPTGSKEVSFYDYGAMARLNVAYDFDDKRGISANFGYFNSDLDWKDEGQERQVGAFTYTVAYGQALGDRIGVYLEAYGEYVEFENWLNSMDAGMTFLLKDNIQLDYSFGWGLDYTMNYHSVGISFYLPTK